MEPFDLDLMTDAVAISRTVRTKTAPDPWVGAAVRTNDGRVFQAASESPGGAHAEVGAIRAARAAGADTSGSSLAVTLEPCASCVHAIVDAGIERVLVAVPDDPAVRDHGDSVLGGIDLLRSSGVDVVTGSHADEVADLLAPYLHHRRTGRPYVVVRLMATVDGRTADPAGNNWGITGDEMRVDVHEMRAQSQATLVGAETVRVDDPSLRTRLAEGNDPLRIVLGSVASDAAIQPCLAWRGDLPALLDQLGSDGVLQLMVEGGANTVSQFHAEGLVNRYVVYLAPAVFGGDDARPMFVGAGVAKLEDLPRGRFQAIRHLGPDLRIDLVLD